jgi:putative redox protein
MTDQIVTVVESGNGRYGQFITAGHHVLGADEPQTVGGNDTGPDPFELVLAGLGACTVMTIRMYADRKQLPLDKIEVRLRRLQRITADKEPKDRFERAIVLEGDLTPEQRARLLEIAERCPVSQALKRGSDIVSLLAGPQSSAGGERTDQASGQPTET